MEDTTKLAQPTGSAYERAARSISERRNKTRRNKKLVEQKMNEQMNNLTNE